MRTATVRQCGTVEGANHRSVLGQELPNGIGVAVGIRFIGAGEEPRSPGRQHQNRAAYFYAGRAVYRSFNLHVSDFRYRRFGWLKAPEEKLPLKSGSTAVSIKGERRRARLENQAFGHAFDDWHSTLLPIYFVTI
jgi:hypothetical protein